VFEKCLDSQNIPFRFEMEHPRKSKRPDYTIEWEGKTVVFEVKDFDPPKTFKTGFMQFDPYLPIREKIDHGDRSSSCIGDVGCIDGHRHPATGVDDCYPRRSIPLSHRSGHKARAVHSESELRAARRKAQSGLYRRCKDFSGCGGSACAADFFKATSCLAAHS